MKNLLIGALVASIILFFWQFLSWSVLGIHSNTMMHTSNQDQILEFLEENLTEGAYFLPMPSPDLPASEHQAMMSERAGDPWARIEYHASLSSEMGSSLIRGIVIDFLAALLLCWVLSKFANLNFSSALISSLSIGFIGYFTISYLNSIWFETSTWGDLIDTIVQWGLVGIWLGWWLPKRVTVQKE